ncbi:MAG: peptide-N-glycosidase F-related protein [Myxococcota bacterium]
MRGRSYGVWMVLVLLAGCGDAVTSEPATPDVSTATDDVVVQSDASGDAEGATTTPDASTPDSAVEVDDVQVDAPSEDAVERAPEDVVEPSEPPPVSGECQVLCAKFTDCPLMTEAICHARCMSAGTEGCALDCLNLGTSCAAAEYCLDLDADAALPWTEGPYGGEWRDLAGPFTLDTLDGPWSFEEEWTGKDSYLFFGGMTGWTYTEDLLGQSFSTLFTTLPKNVHLFFMSHDQDPAPMLLDIQEKVDEALDQMNPLGACRWRHRVHYVATPSFQDTGWVGERFYGTDAESGQTIITRPAFAVDRLQRVRQVGMLANVATGGAPDLRALSYEPVFFNFEAERAATLAGEERFEVTALDAVKTGSTTVDVTFPSAEEMLSYDTMQIEVAQFCDGHDDANCGEWDRLAHLYVCSEPEEAVNANVDTACQAAVDNEAPEEDIAAETLPCVCAVPDGTTVASVQTCRADGSGFDACNCGCNTETARWITTYGREGRWVFDISEYLPLYAKGGVIPVRLNPGNGGYVNTIRYHLSHRGKADRPAEMTYLYSGGGFNQTYNDKYEPLTVTIPEDITSVSLVALISGHGWGTELANCAEFCNHTHHFTVGGDEYVRSHEAFYAVGSSVGCAGSVNVGVVPNQYGTWPLGRAGWCPGLEVPPWVADVTDSVTPGETVTISYQGLYQGADYVPEPNPNSSGGFGANVNMTSWLVFHR